MLETLCRYQLSSLLDFAEEISHRRSQVNPREEGTSAEQENLLGRCNSPVTNESPV